MMAYRSHLEFNPSTKEPFLRLRKHPNTILTPPRLTDAPLCVPYFNDERVHVWLKGPPYPYYEEHARQFIGAIKPQCDHALAEFLEGLKQGDGDLLYLTHSPVRVIREIQEDGSELFLGDIGLDRCGEVEDLVKNSKVDNSTNLKLAAGHPDIVWTIGNYLAPSHHGRGIMSDAVDTLVNDLGRPLLGVRHIVATTFFGNEGSVKVFLKNGFSLERELVDHVLVKGKLQGLNVFERHYDD